MTPLADVYVLDVGQGDSILVHLNSGEVIVVDCHVASRADDVPVINCLADLASKRGGSYDIDLLVLTHPDSDHYKGLIELLEWVDRKGGAIKNMILFAPIPFEVSDIARTELEKLKKNYVERDFPLELRSRLGSFSFKQEEFVRLYRKLSAIKQGFDTRSNHYARAMGFAHFRDFGDASVYILGPGANAADDSMAKVWKEMVNCWLSGERMENKEANEISCILWLKIGEVNILLAGDAPHSRLVESINHYEEFHRKQFGMASRFSLVKASHHGSKTGSSSKLWDQILVDGAQIAISNSAHSGYRHPSSTTVSHLRDSGFKLGMHCTRSCADHLDASDRSLFRILDSIQADERPGEIGRGPAVSMSKTKYYGTLKYTVQSNGIVKFDPEVHPEQQCVHHGGLCLV